MNAVDMTSIWLSTISFLAVVALLAIGIYLFWYNRQFQKMPWQNKTRLQTKQRLHIIERMPLTQQHHLVLIQFDEQEYLILTQPNQSTILTQQQKKP